MNKKKTLFVLFLFSFTLFSFSFPNTDTNPLIVVSSLSTPPPGYAIEKTLGDFFFVDEVQRTIVSVTFQKAVSDAITERCREIAKAAQKQGANAILNEKIEVTFFPDPGLGHVAASSAFITITGEAVVLKEETPSKK